MLKLDRDSAIKAFTQKLDSHLRKKTINEFAFRVIISQGGIRSCKVSTEDTIK